MSGYYRRQGLFSVPGPNPVTKTVLIIAGVSFLFGLLLPSLRLINLNELLLLVSGELMLRPWTLATYPLVNGDFFTLLFAGLWLWFIGGSLEYSWGSRRFAWLLLTITIVTGLAMGVMPLLGLASPIPISGLWLPLTGLTWAWSLLNSRQEVLLYGIIPIQARWLAWIEAGIIFFTYLQYNLFYGLAALAGIPVVYLWQGRGPLTGLQHWFRKRSFAIKAWQDERRQKARRKKLRVLH